MWHIRSNLSVDDVINRLLGRKTTFNKNVENWFVQYCVNMDNWYYSLSSKDLRRLIDQFAEANRIENLFSGGK